MVDIIIGSIGPLGPPANKPGDTGGTLIEAELLHIRNPRQRVIGPIGRERRRQPRHDPFKGKVLTLLIADSALLPRDLDIKNYKVMLRFKKK
ncbi:MAG: hypothetical protein GXY53_10825 [Desulfobulbus sp.]|nr:hypothetical protein [Desulfobulbus sp.]